MKKEINSFIFLITTVFLFYNPLIYSCTTFVLKNDRNLLFGRNLDWYIGTGLLITNQRNLEKIALVDSIENPIKWISKYGSITFNQVGRDLPYGGMNETGLVVEHMSLSTTKYPAKDNRQSIQACQWIQYQLDNCATIEEVINTDKFLRIVDKTSLFHFLICDSSGNIAVIEFLNGGMVVNTGDHLPITVLANSVYEESITSFSRNESTSSDRSLYNFCTAANKIKNYSSNKFNDDIDYSFEILKSVAQGVGTKWSIVYDIKNLKVYFKVFETPTLIDNQKIFLKEEGSAKIKIVDLKEFDFNCSSSPFVIDLEIDKEGLLNSYFTEYTTDINKKIIFKTFNYFKQFGFLNEISEKELNYLAEYPESFNCINKQ
jgi:choloylglycine hydrolase